LNSPHFFCENCGTEVPRDAKNCPKCGRHFASVRCPSCDFIGAEALFKNGCQICGYSSSGGNAGDFEPVELPEIKKPAGSLPLWLYILTAAAFIAILTALLFKIF